MRVILIVQLLVCSASCANAQYSWFVDFKGRDFSSAEDLSVDLQDNVLVIGNFTNGVDIDGRGYDGRGSFLLKLSNKGVPQWHILLRYGAGNFWGVKQIETDAQGNVYIAGTFTSSVTIGSNTLTNGIPFNSMIAKINPKGEVLWTKVITNIPGLYDMKVNDAGNILCYTVRGDILSIDHTILNIGAIKSIGFLLSPQGDLMWARALGMPQKFTTWPKACALDNSGNSYFHGVYNDTLSLDGKQVVSTGGSYDYFFVKLNMQGICQWITAAERKAPRIYESTIPGVPGVVEHGALEVDDQGNVYGGGTYWNKMILGDITLTSAGNTEINNNIFLLKLNSDGLPLWARNPPSSASNTVNNIVVNNGRIYFTGIQTPQFYFAEYTPSGDAVGHEVVIPVSGDGDGGLGVDSKDSVYMSGSKFAQPLLHGFLFRYKPLLPIITEPIAVCSAEKNVLIETSPLAYAQSYEWEITFNTTITLFTTTVPELDLTLSTLGIDGDFLVRVRGVNQFGKGDYSKRHGIHVDNPLQKPQLLATCNSIYLENKVLEPQWYRNDKQLMQYQSQTSIKPDSAGSYHVTVSNGCGIVASNFISYTPPNTGSLFIPNVITPNQDGLNEFFVVDEKLESPSLVVYNRWGKLVYSSSTYSNQWSGDDLPTGVYYYKLTSDCISNPIRGSITILR